MSTLLIIVTITVFFSYAYTAKVDDNDLDARPSTFRVSLQMLYIFSSTNVYRFRLNHCKTNVVMKHVNVKSIHSVANVGAPMIKVYGQDVRVRARRQSIIA
jgi:hypothetical protein